MQEDNLNVIALKGNHEDMLLEYYDGYGENWKYNGYESTLESYSGCFEQFEDDVEWIRTLPLYHEDEHFIYVHAGVDVDKPIEEQNKNTLLWVRENFIYNEKEYYKRVIFGHTPTINLCGNFKPTYTETFNIDIDTACVYGGALSALIIDDDEINGFYQVDSEKKRNYSYDDEYEQYKIY